MKRSMLSKITPPYVTNSMIITAMGPPRAAENVVKISPIPMEVSPPIGIKKCAVEDKKIKTPDTVPITTGNQVFLFTCIERLISSRLDFRLFDPALSSTHTIADEHTITAGQKRQGK